MVIDMEVVDVYETVMGIRKKVGERKGNVYEIKREYPLHFYWKRRGYAISSDVLDEQFLCGANTVRIFETRQNGDMMTYECPIRYYIDAIEFQERNYAVQKCCPLKHMTVQGGIKQVKL